MSSEDNFLISPFGLKLALAILAEAATGSTQNEITSVLGLDLDRYVTRAKFSSIIESLKVVIITIIFVVFLAGKHTYCIFSK